MEVVASCPMLAAGFVWQSSAQTFAQTIIVKATFVLEPGHAKIAPQEAWEPIHSTDRFVNDDRQGSLFAPTDRVPYKRHVDVLVVGHAYAPDKQPARSVVTRMTVGEMDKCVEVVCDRGFRASDNRLLEGPRFTKMALDWTRAAGGPGTTNPVGMRFDALPDAVGLISVPNLQPLKTVVTNRADTFSPVGFGPIAPTWPGRTRTLEPFAEHFSPANWMEHPLPSGFDFEFFQAAPIDQRVARLRPDEPLVLENLHPLHPRLVTNLPGVSPRAVVHRGSGEREDVTFVADTLWIDTDRSICCVVWRGSIGLRHPAEEGLVTVTLVEPVAESIEESLVETIPPSIVHEDELLAMTKLAPFGVKPGGTTMPFVGANIAKRSPNPVRSRDDGVLPFGPNGLSGPPPAPIALGQVTLPAQSPTSSPTVQALVVAEASHVPTPVVAARLSEQIPLAATTAPSMGSIARESEVPTTRDAAPRAFSSVQPQAAPGQFVEGNDCPGRTSEMFQLLWYDAALMKSAREYETWRRVVGTVGMTQDDHAAMAHALLTAVRLDAHDVQTAFAGAVDKKGWFVSPIVAVAGDLEVLFDELDVLRAVTSMAAATATPSDTELNQAIEKARRFIEAPGLLVAPAICADATARIRDAFVKEKKQLPADFLDAPIEEALLLGRRYQMWRTLGETHLRCWLSTPKETQPFVVYLSVEAAQKLPLFKRFRVRLLAEVHPAQHRSEVPGKTLRVIAIARVEQYAMRA